MPEPGLKIIAKLLLLKKYSTSNLNEILFEIEHARKTDFFAFAHARKADFSVLCHRRNFGTATVGTSLT